MLLLIYLDLYLNVVAPKWEILKKFKELNKEINETKTELSNTKEELSNTQSELSNTKNDLSSTNQNLQNQINVLAEELCKINPNFDMSKFK